MKKFFTALLIFFTLNVANVAMAQQNPAPGNIRSIIENNKLTPSQLLQFQALKANSLGGGNRAITPIALDYDGFDELRATAEGGLYSRFIWRIHTQTPDVAIFNNTSRWAAVVYDTIVDATTGLGYNINTTPYTLDSLDVYFTHERGAGSVNPDSIHVIVYAAQGAAGLQVNAQENIVNSILWDTTIVTTTNLTASATTLGILTVYPQTSLGIGQDFVVAVEFRGDTTNQFNLLAGYTDLCNEACAAVPSIVPDNSIYRMTFIPSSGGDFSGVNPLFANCNGNTTYDPLECEDYYIQNWVFIPYLTIDPPFLADPKTSEAIGCPGESVTLTANITGGSGNTQITWTGNGSFTNPNDGVTNVTLPAGVNGAVTYTVEAIDLDNNDTITGTVNVTVRGINVSLGNDTTINCNDSILVLAATTGFLNGSSFVWSNGSITQSTYLKGGETYSVTVTNNAGCSATDSKVVSLNVNQTVSFTATTVYGGSTDTVPLSQNRACQGSTVFFTNTSSDPSNAWSFEWDYGDQTGSINTNGSRAYTSTGTFTVSLTASDASGCVVASAPLQLQILPTNHPLCQTTGVAEVELLSSISLYPNPNAGSFVADLSQVNANEANIMVVDMLGKVVFNTNTFSTVETPVKTIDLNNAVNGIYFVRITANGVTATSKISVAK